MNSARKSHSRLSTSASPKPNNPVGEHQILRGVWTAKVLTLYPGMFPGILNQSLTGKALQDGLWSLQTLDIRQFATDKHRTVDDSPAGGGPGMVLKPDIVAAAIDAAAQDTDPQDWPVICLSPRGRPFTQAMAQRLSLKQGITLICGRFEGIDERVLQTRAIEEISLGDFVLTGGEIAAQALIDATVRLIPRVLGNAESAEDESFSRGLLEYPQYTRPAEWEGQTIPEVLLSGHHGHIANWRQTQAEALTKERRPDLWRAYLAKDRDPVEDRELSDAQTIADKGEQKDE